ncbi:MULTISPECIES: hypothetical protein [unclassified Paenibacillus]|uniref:hypothetical protein n=1 Tax=unclassified Paenibacillus TaxID=185978 RepID=UPI00020D726E|nr:MULTISPECIES: hypothetical protein [unclassified Paenibacillus]EGL17474.1 hypothetical protein HMPREF9413_5366 [Paenibacillus sp. HGF7]EPD81306.1 hypothetical protein HMPREF1207_05063 [Paenibacillus sp. HGH0039]
MLKDLSFEEISKFFEELATKDTGRFQLSRIYGMAKTFLEQREKEEEIEKLIVNDYRSAVNTTIISEDLAVVEVEVRLNKTKEIAFYPVVDNKLIKESRNTFDEALLLGFCKKYNNEKYDSAIFNMLRMDLYMNRTVDES